MATVEQRPAQDSQAGERNAIPVENPATGETITTVPRMSPSEVKAMAGRARAAQPEWEAMGFEGRGRILRRAQKWVTDNSDRIIDTSVAETGKTNEDAQLAETTYAANAFGFWAKMAPEYLADEKVKSSNLFVKGARLVVRYQPLGVVGVIGPWNYPLTNSFGDCIPALAAGNAAILKPAEKTPLTSLLMAECLRECGMPENVFQVATGQGSVVGNTLIDEVDFVMFTGSTETGKKVMERAARTLTPVGLELGGKDPMIVLSDADVERAANAAVFYSMQNAGQTCISVERVYVEEPIHDEFVSLVADKAKELRQGVPGEFGSVDVGSFINPPQAEIVKAHVEDAVNKGARVLAGGHGVDGPGSFFEPTVIAGADHSMAAMTEETFGPTLPIMKVHDEDEAVRMANDSPYGLQASVFTKDMSRADRVARQLQAGAVVVNDCGANYSAFEAPMGGWTSSGIGVRHGPQGIRKYTQPQTIVFTRFALKKDIYMFPYSKLRSDLLLRFLKLLYGRGSRD